MGQPRCPETAVDMTLPRMASSAGVRQRSRARLRKWSVGSLWSTPHDALPMRANFSSCGLFAFVHHQGGASSCA